MVLISFGYFSKIFVKLDFFEYFRKDTSTKYFSVSFLVGSRHFILSTMTTNYNFSCRTTDYFHSDPILPSSWILHFSALSRPSRTYQMPVISPLCKYGKFSGSKHRFFCYTASLHKPESCQNANTVKFRDTPCAFHVFFRKDYRQKNYQVSFPPLNYLPLLSTSRACFLAGVDNRQV